MKTGLELLRQQLRQPQHSFAATLDFIERNYHYQPAQFRNGTLVNRAGQNHGSCKILALAQLEHLSDEEALLAFGEHYRHVLDTPQGNDHQNIRQLLQHGLAGVAFASTALRRI